MKDATPYLAVWKQPQTIVFDLGNLVNDIYTAPFNATLTVKFFNAPLINSLPPADAIVPISAARSGSGAPSAFRLPSDRALTVATFPENVTKAVVSLAACGQMAEEFWWSNVPDSAKSTFGGDSELLAHSPFREVQLLIDGHFAGVAWPFPVIFTGGIAPGFWRPVVGIDAFDLKEYEINITPWVPIIADGNEHIFEIRVVGLSDDGLGNAALSDIGSYWVVTGKIFLWLDDAGPVFPGLLPVVSDPEPDVFITATTDASNSTLQYQVLVQRQFSAWNYVHARDSRTGGVEWSQRLSYSNVGRFSDEGNAQENTMVISGTETFTGGYSRKFAYPLQATTHVKVNEGSKGFSIDAALDFSKSVQLVGNSVFPAPLGAFEGTFDGWLLTNRQNGTAYYFTDGKSGGSGGSTEQQIVVNGLQVRGNSSTTKDVKVYSRHVLATNNSVVADSEADQELFNNAVSSQKTDFAPLSNDAITGGKLFKSMGM